MKYQLQILLAFILFGCSNLKEQDKEPDSENKLISFRITYRYTFNYSGKIEIKTSTTYLYSNGVFIDSITSSEKFFYKKNQIIRVEGEENEYRFYNKVDSLTATYRINSFGDTTLIEQNIYENGKIKRSINRYLRSKLGGTDLRLYDTIFNQLDHVYVSDTLEISYYREAHNELISENHFSYRNHKKVKAVNYNFLGAQKYVNGITYYNTDSDPVDPDYVTLSPSGDTIGIGKTFYRDTIKVVKTYFADIGAVDNLYYNNSNQLVKSELINILDQKKRITTFLYDIKGHLIEETHFTEKISASVE